MKKQRQQLQHIVRSLGLMPAVEWYRQRRSAYRNRVSNAQFQRNRPDFPTPPPALAFDAYGNVDWQYYHDTGQATARTLADMLQRHSHAPAAILEWGCGPGRIIRHLPALWTSARIVGTDYNPQTIAWLRQALPHIEAHQNALTPPLPFGDGAFDFVYAFSVFTHLSESNCLAWMAELRRVMIPDALLYFTTNSQHAADYLLPHERAAYDRDGIVYRGGVEEGKKMATSWMHPDWVQTKMLQDCHILEHLRVGPYQTGWLVRR